ncbi:MAG: Gfo/Idh/MocA family oxidoreductase, partial [Nocardioidaceae bacterium]
AGAMVAPRVEPREPLRTEIEHFVECVRTGRPPLTDARHGLDVVRVLEAAERSAAACGSAVQVADFTLVGH